MQPTLEQLKAHAYDAVVQMEMWSKRLRELNKLIEAEKNKAKVEEVKKD
jgi:hypothetical protein